MPKLVGDSFIKKGLWLGEARRDRGGLSIRLEHIKFVFNRAFEKYLPSVQILHKKTRGMKLKEHRIIHTKFSNR